MSYPSTPSAVGPEEVGVAATERPTTTEHPSSSRPKKSEPLPPTADTPPDVAAAVPEPLAMREATTPAALVAVIPAAGRLDTSPSHAAASETRRPDEDSDPRLRLELLLLSGERMTLRCRPEERVAEVKQRIRKEWPVEWTNSHPAPETSERLGLLFRGRFLPDDCTLEAAGVDHPEGSDHVVVHLHIRSIQPLDNTGTATPGTAGSSCCPVSCLIV